MTEIEQFEIRPDVICQYYEGHNNLTIKKAIADFYLYDGKAKNIQDLYFDLIERKGLQELIEQLPDKDQMTKQFVTSACARKMKEQIDFYSGWENFYYFWGTEIGSPKRGVILDQDVLIDKVQYPGTYKRLFAYIFNQTNRCNEFLSYHLERSFQSDKSKYKLFLLEIEKENKDLIESGEKFLDEWISQNSKHEPISSSRDSGFKNIFREEFLYNHVIKILSESSTTFDPWFDGQGNWIRVSKRGDNSGAVGALFTILSDRGYLSSEFDSKKIPVYSKDFFQVDVGKTKRLTDFRYTTRFDQLDPMIKFAKSLIKSN